jgi:hypothetical protein
MKSQQKREIKERRSLLAGLTETVVDPSVEKAFVHGTQPKPAEKTPPPTTSAAAASETRGEGQGQPANPVSRSPLTSRVRADLAVALKRASLQRQLDGETPNSLQDLLEEALEAWLRSNGYLN